MSITFKGRYILMSTEIEVNNCFCYMTFHLRMKILLLLLLLLKTCSTFNLRHLKSFSQVLATVIKILNVVFCIFKCILILLMGNIENAIIKPFLQVVYSNKDK